MALVQHIALNCRDKERTEAFYTKHFGFKRARVFNDGQPGEFVMLRLGGVCIELFNAPPEHKDLHGGEQPIGFKHFAFEVPSLEEAIAKLKADGISTEEIIDCSWVTEGMRVCFFDDPDGNRMELMQGYQDQF